MYLNLRIEQALIRDRVGELRRSAASNELDRRTPRATAIETARNATGWLLVDLGLRLATPATRSTIVPRPAAGSPRRGPLR